MNALLETTRKLVQDLRRIGFGDPHVPINGALCVDVINNHFEDWSTAFVEYDADSNARLKDAAPELLAALESMLLIDDWHDEEIASARTIQAARAAVAKAKGWEPESREPRRGRRAVKVVKLEEAHNILEHAAAVIWDKRNANLSLSPLTDDPENQWLHITVVDDAGYEFSCKFCQGNNEAVKLEGVCMILTDHEGDDVQLTVLAGKPITHGALSEPEPTFRITAKPTKPGWYWYWQQNDADHKAEATVVRMYQDDKGRIRFADSGVLATDTPEWCEWSGPITPGGDK